MISDGGFTENDICRLRIDITLYNVRFWLVNVFFHLANITVITVSADKYPGNLEIGFFFTVHSQFLDSKLINNPWMIEFAM
jgi:hypothetical protein